MFIFSIDVYFELWIIDLYYNNQISARALIQIGQSAMVCCASKLMEKSHVL